MVAVAFELPPVGRVNVYAAYNSAVRAYEAYPMEAVIEIGRRIHAMKLRDAPVLLLEGLPCPAGTPKRSTPTLDTPAGHQAQ